MMALTLIFLQTLLIVLLKKATLRSAMSVLRHSSSFAFILTWFKYLIDQNIFFSYINQIYKIENLAFKKSHHHWKLNFKVYFKTAMQQQGFALF